MADSTGLLVGSNYGPFSSGWQLVTFDWKATKTTTATFQLTTFLSAGAMYFDDFHVLDVTDEKDIAANAGAISQMNTRVTAAEGAITTQAQQLTKLSGDLAVTNAAVSQKAEQSAVTGLTTRMTSAEGKLDSQSQQLTSLQNSLTTMNTELGKKADTSAVSSLTGRVSQVENTITSQSQSITSLTSTINTIRTQGANPWVDGTFESYSDGQVLGGNGTAVVVVSQKFTGDKSLKLRRDENNGGNSDKQLGTWQSIREDAKFRFEFWAMMPADQAPSSGWTTLVGIQSQNAAGQNAWQAAVTVSEASLGARDKWVKFTGIASNNGAGRTRAVVWISTRGATGNGTPGYSLYIDDLVITDVTDAKAAQDASDATASAVSGLTARVTDAEGKITAQAQQQTALATKVDIGSFAINIAQHRTRKVPKATWQWFELARFRRQNFDQVINIRGGLLQTDSITIDGGAKLRAGMSYAPGSDGGLDPGYLSYAMLLRGTGATSGGGSMELGIELMYETGGATRLLTAQESMNVDNMSFVVPAGTGDAVLRYGCYLDRNGQMVLTILSRFDAFAARNNNVIRAASSA
ncbi:TPA: hypothetical protein ACXP51_004564 [Klebsiella variicola subsp. variicola]